MTESHSAARLRVLIVEDNLDAAHSMKMLLSRWGYEVRVAHDGPTGLEIAGQFWPHVVLLDIGLPAMDGWQLAALMRDHPATRQALRLALTAYDKETDVERSLATGLHDHMVKPVNVAELRRVLDRLAKSEIDRPQATMTTS